MALSSAAAASTVVVTIGERAGGAGGVQEAPSGLRSTAKRVAEGSPGVQERDTFERLAATAFKPVGIFAVAGWAAADGVVTKANRKAEITAWTVFICVFLNRSAEPTRVGRK